MRYFNTHGPVNAAEHYIVARRPLVEGLVAQIQQGKYLAISAPRQMGKTTLLRALDAELDARPDFLSIDLTFEATKVGRRSISGRTLASALVIISAPCYRAKCRRSAPRSRRYWIRC